MSDFGDSNVASQFGHQYSYVRSSRPNSPLSLSTNDMCIVRIYHGM